MLIQANRAPIHDGLRSHIQSRDAKDHRIPSFVLFVSFVVCGAESSGRPNLRGHPDKSSRRHISGRIFGATQPNVDRNCQLATLWTCVHFFGGTAMARQNRSEIFDPEQVSVMHCINRAVRRAMLCGFDRFTGQSFEHRRDWVKNRLKFLAANYGIDVLGYAVMGNHLHVILRNRPDIVSEWTDEEVARRIWNLFPKRKNELLGPPSQCSLDGWPHNRPACPPVCPVFVR